MKKLCLILVGFVSSATVSLAATDWTNGGNDSSWSDAANWSAGVPTLTSDVVIQTQPTNSSIGVDTGSQANTVASVTFANSLTAGVSITALSVETLTVDGNITNSSSSADKFNLPVDAGANATVTGGTSGVSFNVFDLQDQTIATSGSVNVDQQLDIDIDSLSSFGSIGSVHASGAEINIGGTYTGHLGDTFDLTSGNFLGASIGALPTLSGGLSWNTSNFLADGELQVVPEPSDFAYLAIGCVALILFARRRRA